MSPRQRRAPRPGVYDPPEAAFQAHVLQAAALQGWMAYHPYDSRRSQRGFPDLVLLRPSTGPGPQLHFAELKSRTGSPTPEQLAWLAGLSAVEQATGGIVRAHLWRPDDMDTRVARALARPGLGPRPEPPAPAA